MNWAVKAGVLAGSSFAGSEPEAQVSRRYAAAQAWVANRADPTLPDRRVGDERFEDVLVRANTAVGNIWAGANCLPSPRELLLVAEGAVAALESACAALGYKRLF